jgi:CheY-like chemotaxis protein
MGNGARTRETGNKERISSPDISMRRIVTLWLELHEVLVVQAEDGQEALGEMKKRQFDAVLAEYRTGSHAVCARRVAPCPDHSRIGERGIDG